MSQKNTPKVILVGAGPGDPELITVKGLQAIRSADVILYDALVNPELLEQVPVAALKIYVGKRNNQHAYSQDEINAALVSLAYAHGHVVRLKGGDPFVFGRGQEELNYVKAFAIETEVIPGISSSISVPALAGIPVTHRGASESFWVITGTTKDNAVSNDVFDAAKTNATVVILMGLSKLKEITEIFTREGKQDTAIALVQDGSLPTQRIALGTISTIVEEAQQQGIKAPAVIVIGEVVKQQPDFAALSQSIKSLAH